MWSRFRHELHERWLDVVHRVKWDMKEGWSWKLRQEAPTPPRPGTPAYESYQRRLQLSPTVNHHPYYRPTITHPLTSLRIQDKYKMMMRRASQPATPNYAPPLVRILGFKGSEDLPKWTLLLDDTYGGTSTASLTIEKYEVEQIDKATGEKRKRIVTVLVFAGELRSMRKFALYGKGDWDSRSDPRPDDLIPGFCGFVSPAFQPALDLSDYDALELSVRTCGRPYVFNIKCDAKDLHEDIWRGLIKAEQPRPLHTLSIGFPNLRHTFRGFDKAFGYECPKEQLSTFGFSVTGPPGPFRFELEYIDAKQYTASERRLAAAEMEQQRIYEMQQRAAAQSRPQNQIEKEMAKTEGKYDWNIPQANQPAPIPETTTTTTTTTSHDSIPTVRDTSAAAAAAEARAALSSEGSDDELVPPGPNATDAEIVAYHEKIQQRSKQNHSSESGS